MKVRFWRRNRSADLDDEIRDHLRRAEAARLPPDPSEVAALADLIESHALAERVLKARPEAERQLELAPEAALRELASAT